MEETRCLADNLHGLRTIADATFRLTFTFAQAEGKMRLEIRKVANEIQEIAGLLHQLSLLASILGDENGHGHGPGVPSQLISCHRTLESLERSLLRRKADAHLKNARLKWPFTTAWTADLLQELSECKDTISRGLSTESMSDLQRVFSNEKYAMRIDQDDSIFKHTDTAALVASQPGSLEVIDFFLKFDQKTYLNRILEASHPLHNFAFLKSSEFEDWLSKKGLKVWFTAAAGAGKTMFAGAMVQEAIRRRHNCTVVVFVFCRFSDLRTHSSVNVLSTIAAQVARQDPAAFNLLRDYYKELHQHRRTVKATTVDHLVSLLLEMSRFFEHILVVVDGVDECGNESANIAETLATLMTRGGNSFSLAIVSRDKEGIRDMLLETFRKVDVTPSEAALHLFTATEWANRAARGDLKFYEAPVKDKAIRELCLGAETTFWQIYCHINHMCKSKSCDTTMEFLETLPCNLETTYTRILKNFNAEDPASKSLIQSALLLVAYSNPPLTTTELCQALSTADIAGLESLEAEISKYPEIDESEVLKQCGVILRKSASIDRVEFAHCTIQEFLVSIDLSDPDLSDYSLSEARSNRLLTLSALRFLCLENFSRFPGLSTSEENFIQNRDARFPFYRFAALTWHKLAANQWNDPEVLAEAMVLFDPKQTANFKSWCLEVCRHYLLHGSWNKWRESRDRTTAIRLRGTASSVCSETTQISDSSTNLPPRSSDGESSDSEPVRRYILPGAWRWRKHAPERNWYGGETRRLTRVIRRGDFTPLHMAALLGLEPVCRELLSRGENVNRPSKLGTPLQCALGGPFLIACHNMSAQRLPDGWVERPSRKTVELLIESGADCTRSLPSQMYSWETTGALSLKASEWAGDSALFGLVVRGGAQLYDDDIAVFRSICRRWTKHKDESAFSMIVSILDLLSDKVSKGEGESSAYLKAFQKCVSETTDIDTPLPSSEGISDEMLIQKMWNAIAEDNLNVLEEKVRSSRCSEILQGDTLTKLLDFAATCQSISCLDYLLTEYVDVDEQDNRKSQMVLNCVDNKSEDILLCLLKHGSSTTRVGHGRNNIWHLAAGDSTSLRLLKALLAHVGRTECEEALRAVNKDGRTPLAEALFFQHYQNASAIIGQFGGDQSLLQSIKPPLSQIIARFDNVDVLKALYANSMVLLPTKESPLNYLDDSADIEVVQILLSTYTYEKSESGKSPLENYLKATKLHHYNNEILTALIKADLSQKAENTPQSIWQYVCKKLRETLKQPPAVEAEEYVHLVRILIEHGCLAAYEKDFGISGLKEIRGLFSTDKLASDNGNVPIIEDILILVLDSTTQPYYLQSSGLDVNILKWSIYYDSMFLFDRVLQIGVDVCSRKHETNALEFLCSNGSGPNGYRMLVKFLERVDKKVLSQLTPTGEGLSLLHRLGLADGRAIKSFGCPAFRSATPFSDTSRPPPPPMGYSRLSSGGFADARQPLDNLKFSLVQRLLEEKVDCKLVSRKTNFSPMSTHVSAGYVDTARILLRHGANQVLHVADVYGWTPVAWACAHGYIDLLEEMAAACCPEPIWNFRVQVSFSCLGIAVKSYREISALHLAAIASPETVTFLLDRGFATDIDVLAADFSTPLHIATFFGLRETIQVLVSRGCNINAQTSEGLTALHISVYHQNESAVSLLLELGAAHLKTKKGETPLDAAVKRNNKNVVDLISKGLRMAPEDATAPEPDRVQRHLAAAMSKAMEDAIEEGNLAACERLLDSGCPPNIKMRSCHACTALLFALSRNTVSTAIVNVLIAKGASFRGATCSRQGFHISSSYGVRYFEDSSSDTSFNSSTSDSDEETDLRWPMRGSTCLDFLMWENDLSENISAWLRLIPENDMVWLLDNSVAVQVAIDGNCCKTLGVLLQYVSDLGALGGRNLIKELVNEVPTRRINSRDNSPLHDAANEKRVEIARLLLQHGAEVDRQNHAQRTPLHIAIKADDLEMAKLFLDHGASMHIREMRGYTPLEVAITDASLEMVQLFLDKGARIDRNLDSDSSFMCESTNMAVSMLKAGMKLNQVGSFGIPLWTPAIFQTQLATYILNSEHSTFLMVDMPGRALWKLIWHVHVVEGGSSMHRALRLLYRRLGLHFIRQITEFEGDERDKPFSILCFSAHFGLVDEVKMLLKMGCDIEFEGSVVGTPLMAAAHEGRVEIVKSLVLEGARIQYQKAGVWRSAVAAAKNFPEIVHWLLVKRFTEQDKIEGSPDGWKEDVQAQVCLWSGYRPGVFPLEGKYARGWGDSTLRWLSCLEKAKRNFKGKVVVSHLRDISA